MWLVVSDHGDPVAAFVAAGLRDLDDAPVEHVDSHDLARCVGWEHRVEGERVCGRLELADGRTIDTRAITGTVNRLGTIPQPPGAAGSPDRDYLDQEMFALMLSWLHSVPGPVLNPPTPTGLAGRHRPEAEWAVLAARAGLATPPLRLPRASAGALPAWSELAFPIVVGGTVLAAPSERIRTACLELSALADTPVLGIALGRHPDADWRFLEATTAPDLRPGGDDAVRALGLALGNGGRPR